MGVLLTTVFIASLLGSLHCVGMCGPFALLAGASGDEKKSAVVPAIAYSSGRLITYALVGALFGTIGMMLNRGTALATGSGFSAVQQTATYVAGGLMILVGLIALARQLGVRVRLPRVASGLQKILNKAFKRITSQPPVRKAFSIGALSCLMPCGWLYTFAIVAGGTASPLWGTIVMVAFWAGTVPVMFALMTGLNRIGRTIQKRVPLAMATMVILIGVFTIAFRAPVVIGDESRLPVNASASELAVQVQEVDHSELPCCADKSKEAGEDAGEDEVEGENGQTFENEEAPDNEEAP